MNLTTFTLQIRRSPNKGKTLLLGRSFMCFSCCIVDASCNCTVFSIWINLMVSQDIGHVLAVGYYWVFKTIKTLNTFLFIITSNMNFLAWFKSEVNVFHRRTQSCSLSYYRENTRITYHTESTEAGIKLQKLTGGISLHILFIEYTKDIKYPKNNSWYLCSVHTFFLVMENDIVCELCFSGKQRKLNWNSSEQLFLRKLHLSH